MTMQTQDIFNKFGSNWTWASISKHGNARVYTGEPVVLASGLIQSPFGERVSRCEAFDNSANTEVLIWKRTDFTNGPSYATDNFGIALAVPAAAPQTQQPAPLPHRGYCTNEDCWNEKAIGWNQCETHRPPLAPAPVIPPPTAATLTTDEAENGGLWAFANHDENYVSVNSFGVVWFDLFKDGPKPRRSYAVEVSGVVNPIERVRSKQVSPAEAGMPFAPSPAAQPMAPRIEPERPYGNPDAAPFGARPGCDADDNEHGWAPGVAELERKIKKLKRKLDQIGQRVEFLVEHEHFDHATGLMILTGLPE